jgi:hypothetical protein
MILDHTTYEKILKVEETDNFDLRIGWLNNVFCLFFSMGRAVKNDQLIPEISVIFCMCLNLLKCPINTKHLPYVMLYIAEYNPL